MSKITPVITQAIENWRIAHDKEFKAQYPDNEQRFSEEKFSYTIGPKYIKLITNNRAHAFIVNIQNDKKFKYGDILKPASWKTPTRNVARGNIFGDYEISIYGL